MAQTELALNSVCHNNNNNNNNNNTLSMTHITPNSTHYNNFWLHMFNSTRVVQSVKLCTTSWIVLWSKCSGGEISFSVQTGPGTDPAASMIGKGALTSGENWPERGTDFSFPCREEVKHGYSCTSEHHLCQS